MIWRHIPSPQMLSNKCQGSVTINDIEDDENDDDGDDSLPMRGISHGGKHCYSNIIHC